MKRVDYYIFSGSYKPTNGIFNDFNRVGGFCICLYPDYALISPAVSPDSPVAFFHLVPCCSVYRDAIIGSDGW